MKKALIPFLLSLALPVFGQANQGELQLQVSDTALPFEFDGGPSTVLAE